MTKQTQQSPYCCFSGSGEGVVLPRPPCPPVTASTFIKLPQQGAHISKCFRLLSAPISLQTGDNSQTAGDQGPHCEKPQGGLQDRRILEGFFSFTIRCYLDIPAPQAPEAPNERGGLGEGQVKRTLPSFTLQAPNSTETAECSGADISVYKNRLIRD